MDLVIVIVAELDLESLSPTVPAALAAGLAMSKQPIISGDEYFIATWKTHDQGKISL
jgi:hypothetical protein